MRPRTHDPRWTGILVTAMKWPSMFEVAMRRSTIHAVLRDSLTDFTYPLKFMFLFAMHSTRTENAPMLPASVGVKSPFIIPTMMTRKMTIGQITSGTVFHRALHVNASHLGPRDGFILHHPKMTTTKKKAMSKSREYSRQEQTCRWTAESRCRK